MISDKNKLKGCLNGVLYSLFKKIKYSLRKNDYFTY